MNNTDDTNNLYDPDPFDGAKAIGCLFIGVVLIAAFVSASAWIIHLIR